MTTDSTVDWLRWHAGLEIGRRRHGTSISDCTYAKDGANSLIESAVEDCLHAFDVLNREINGPTSSATSIRTAVLPRNVVYAATEIIRMLHDSARQGRGTQREKLLYELARKIELGWSAVLAGDIDSIIEHVAYEEAAGSR